MISRSELNEVVADWVAGRRDAEFVWSWAIQAKQKIGRRKTNKDDDALVRDIVDILATLPYDLVTCEDGEVMLDALANPVAEADLSANMVWNHMDGINLDERQHRLTNDAFYGQFCDASG